jgi:hypothetical protein
VAKALEPSGSKEELLAIINGENRGLLTARRGERILPPAGDPLALRVKISC